MKSIGWNEELELLKSGKLAENIEAKSSPDDTKNNTMRKGFRPGFFRGFISLQDQIEIDNKAYEQRERARDTRQIDADTPSEVEIPHNQNRTSASEIREDYIWQIPLGMFVVFTIVIFLATH